MPFAQLVLGPPGSGKSTFCDGMHQFLSAIGRKCSVVNLDPANERTSYPCALDVRDLLTVEEIMRDEELGPNGAVLYALEELEENWDWLAARLKELGEDYVLFDCPGQVELFTHHSSLRNIFLRIQKLGYRLVVLNLTDSYCLTQPSLYISVLLLSLRTMLQMDLPHVNVLTKIDKLADYGPLPFNLDFYTEVQDLSYMLPHLMDEQRQRIGGPPPAKPEGGTSADAAGGGGEGEDRFDGLNRAIVDLVEDFNLINFETLTVEDRRSMMALLRAIDRAGGYAFGSAEGANDSVWQVAMRDEGFRGMTSGEVQERWIDRREELDEKERREQEELAKMAPRAQGGGLEGEGMDEDLGDLATPVRDSGVKVVRKGK